MTIKSISFNQHEILQNILDLYCSTPIQVDMSYGHGGFYKKGIEKPKICIEINSALVDKYKLIKADCRQLPLGSELFDTIILDGPFGIGSGPSLKIKKPGQNITPNRFGCFPTAKALQEFYLMSIGEGHRILKNDGIFILKIQPVVACGKQWMTHHFCMDVAKDIGFIHLDEFVLLAKHRPISGKIKEQQHARKYHSYFYVFEKKAKKNG